MNFWMMHKDWDTFFVLWVHCRCRIVIVGREKQFEKELQAL